MLFSSALQPVSLSVHYLPILRRSAHYCSANTNSLVSDSLCSLSLFYLCLRLTADSDSVRPPVCLSVRSGAVPARPLPLPTLLPDGTSASASTAAARHRLPGPRCGRPVRQHGSDHLRQPAPRGRASAAATTTAAAAGRVTGRAARLSWTPARRRALCLVLRPTRDSGRPASRRSDSRTGTRRTTQHSSSRRWRRKSLRSDLLVLISRRTDDRRRLDRRHTTSGPGMLSMVEPRVHSGAVL